MNFIYLKVVAKLPIFARRVLLVLAGLSLGYTTSELVTTRNDAYQECDSTSVYYVLDNFPRTAYSFSLQVLPNIAQVSLYPSIRDKLLDMLANTFPEKKRETLEKSISNFNLISLQRGGVIWLLNTKYVPDLVKNMLSVPLSGTFSIGQGLLYGSIYTISSNYQTFMTVSLLVTILAFSASNIFLFLLLRNIEVNLVTSLLFCTIYLFSINNYAYSRHLGSTIWLISSSVVWLYYVSRSLMSNRALMLITIIAFLFNYFIFFYYTIYVLYSVAVSKKIQVKLSLTQFKDLRIYLVPYIVITILTLLFFPFGQTSPSTTNWSGIGSEAWFIVMNLFSVNKEVGLTFQYIIGLCIILSAIASPWWVRQEPKEISKSIVVIIYTFLFIWGLLISFGVIALAPTRHVLFIAPLLLILSAYTLSNICERMPILKILLALALAPWVILCLLGFSARINDLRDNARPSEYLLKQVKHVLINDCSFHLLYKGDYSNTTLLMANGNHALDPTKNFEAVSYIEDYKTLYISQTTPFDRWKELNSQRAITFDSEYGGEIKSNVFFTAYNPDLFFSDPRFTNNRPNNYYYQIFEIRTLRNSPKQ